MTIGRTFAIIVTAAMLLAVSLGAITGVALSTADAAVKRIAGTNGQLEALHDLDGAAGRYGRQVVDQLLFGYDRSGVLQTARNDMQRILTGLARATREEFGVVSGPEELQGQLPELERVRRMTDLFYEVDRAATQSFILAGQGKQKAAMDMASRQVDFPLTNEMQPLIDKAISDERIEIAAKSLEFEILRNRIALAGGALALLLLAGIIAAAVVASRYFDGQVTLLTGRVRAVLKDQAGVSAVPSVNPGFKQLSLALEDAGEALAGERNKRASADAQLRAFDTERSQFLADVGHQLRTPVTVLRGEADVALRGAASEPALRESMERVRAQSVELALLLDDLIDAVRPEADALPMILPQVKLAEIVAAAAREGKVLAEPREVDILFDHATGPMIVLGDFRRLKQALMIGIDNAVKHSPPGGTIRIATGTDGQRVTVRIADEGPGIAAEDQPHLFRRFYRGRQEKELLNTGFGIGLSIAKGIVEEHGGGIDLHNRPEGGALFVITLPLIGQAGR